jgi:Leucine-rich repeat (LRR) protein
VWSRQRLNASENKLTSLTSAVGFLSSLLTLELANNQITALPVEVSGLRSLTKLDLSKNQLASLPKQLGDLRCLQVLNVSQNVIRALPSKPFGTLCNLEELHLWGNSLTALPPHMTRLTRLTLLALHRNKIFALDKSFPKLTSLLGLSVANIYISGTTITTYRAALAANC